MDARIENRLFIGGKYVEPQSGRYFSDIEPATGRELAKIPDAAPSDVDAAVGAARNAANGAWPRMGAEARAAVINRFADGIERRAKELARLEARDVGKPIAECLANDVSRAARNMRFFAAAAQTWTQEAAFSD